jgi:hypothetical protein
MLSFVDSHSSLSQKKDKNTDRSLAHSHQLSSSSRSSESTHFIHSKKAAEPHTQNNKHKTKENRRKRASPIFISAAASTGFPIQQQQRQSIQFQSTKLNQFSPSFNAQLSPACNSHTVNRQSQLKPHARKQSSTKFTIKLQGVLIFSVATHAKQSASCTTQQIIKSMKTRTHGQPTVSAKQAQRKQRNTKCVNCNCILMQSIKTQPQ